MAGPAAAAAPVYVAGAALFAGAAYLLTPAGRRASESFGEAVYDGGAQAVENITDLFSSDDDGAQTGATPTTTTTTQEGTQQCDGPHRGRFQAQGYRSSQEPRRVETSVPWERPCIPPLKPEGRVMTSLLLTQTTAISFQGAGLRGPCFSRMSQHVNAAPPLGYLAGHTIGWGITPTYQVRRNTSAGRDAPRVDLEVHAGRAFGTR